MYAWIYGLLTGALLCLGGAGTAVYYAARSVLRHWPR